MADLLASAYGIESTCDVITWHMKYDLYRVDADRLKVHLKIPKYIVFAS